jgi:HAD superfamily hydrolase (TIGR01509 family)
VPQPHISENASFEIAHAYLTVHPAYPSFSLILDVRYSAQLPFVHTATMVVAFLVPVLLPRRTPSVQPARNVTRACAAAAPAVTKRQRAVLFDCDGVILESEELHRVSYNQCWAAAGLGFEWSYEFYEMLQNSVGGGREKMNWYFGRYGWPAALVDAPQDERDAFVRRLHEEKTALYKALIAGGDAKIRPGVLRVIDAAHAAGCKLAVCSAANASSVDFVLQRLVGEERLKKFDLVLAGDAVTRKKPDPLIYVTAAEALGVLPEDCVVIEDSQIGLQAGLAANMKVIITHTPYTASQLFDGATAVYTALGDIGCDENDPKGLVTLDTLFPVEVST